MLFYLDNFQSVSPNADAAPAQSVAGTEGRMDSERQAAQQLPGATAAQSCRRNAAAPPAWHK